MVVREQHSLWITRVVVVNKFTYEAVRWLLWEQYSWIWWLSIYLNKMVVVVANTLTWMVVREQNV